MQARRRRRPDDRPGHRPRRRHRPARTGAAPHPLRRRRSPTSAAPRTPWPTSSSPPAGTPTSSSGASAPRRSRWPRRSSAGCCRRPTPARPGSSPSPAGWSRPARWAGTPSTTPSTATPCRCRSPTPSATRSRRPCWPPCWSAACATAAGRGSTSPSRPGYANDCLAENAPPGQFVTGQLLRVDLHTGTAVIVNAGHPLPAPAARRPGGGDRAARRAAVRRAARARPSSVQPFPLEPGDRIVFLTDGMQERNAASLDVAAALADTADLHPREVVHALGAAVLDATGGRPPRRRHDGLPRLVRRPAPRPEHRAGRRPRPRLAERLTGAPGEPSPPNPRTPHPYWRTSPARRRPSALERGRHASTCPAQPAEGSQAQPQTSSSARRFG